ncbi:MAG: DUF1592 domain-containing protein [Opitutaceae bacterium]
MNTLSHRSVSTVLPTLLAMGGLTTGLAREPAPIGPAPAVIALIDRHCAQCHDSESRKGGLDLDRLLQAPRGPTAFATWVKVHDRVLAGEMPPKSRERPPPEDLSAFIDTLGAALLAEDSAVVAGQGRAVQRRLNRYEYESTLRDLLSLPALNLRDSLPEDPSAHGYNKIGEALDVSHVQMARYLRAAEFALRAAIAPQTARPETTIVRYPTWLQPGFSKTAGPRLRMTFPIVGLELQSDLVPLRDPANTGLPRPSVPSASKPERRDQEAVVMLMSTYEPAEIQFNRFRAPISGRYRLRFAGYTVWMAPDFSGVSRGRRSEPVTIYADTTPRLLRRLGAFDFAPDSSEHTLDVWLQAGETIRPDAARLVRSRPPDFKNPLAEADGMPGVAFQWMEVEGPLVDTWPGAGHRLLFGDLPIKNPPVGTTPGESEKRAGNRHVEVTSPQPEADAARLLRGFMERAYRGPVPSGEVDRFAALARKALASGTTFTDAMVTAYTAVLSSPGFLYFQPGSGRLKDPALAERLAYFLWNSPPDDELRRLAARGRLSSPQELARQVDRLLDDPRASRFAEAFLDYWLDLRHLGASGPDAELYPEYQLDDLLVESLPEETRRFFLEVVRRDLRVNTLVDAPFAMLNERLATLYGIAGVTGVDIREVPLPHDSVRGGLLTQGSILKVTANGTTSSPVVRGAWVMGRILGRPPPPPPPSVPAVESDIRGATTIREQLALHRSQASCNACHRLIDPPGLALESFDVMGGWRDRYRSAGAGDPVSGFGHDGLKIRYRLGPTVDPSGEMPDGRPFTDIRSFKAILAADEAALAANLARQLSIYATGAPVRFSDRPAITRIVTAATRRAYGVRSLIHALVQDDLFRNK